MLIKNIFSGLFQLSLFLIVKLSLFLGLIKLSTYNKFLIWIIKFNGPVSIKVFQILGSTKEINNLFGDDFIDKIKHLQDNIYPNRKRHLNIFDYSRNEPLATGTIGQVYTIKLTKHKDGILKISHSNIKKEIKDSINSFKLVKQIFKIINKKLYNLIKNVDLDEFYKFLINQTNFRIEAENIIKFNNIFLNHDIVRIPKVIDYSENYLVMSKEKGYKLEDFIKIYPDYKDETISLIYSMLYYMIKKGMIHGDLHFGNFLFNLNKGKKKVEITLLDYGIICPLTANQSKHLINFIKKNDNKSLIIFLTTIIDFPDDFKNSIIYESNNIKKSVFLNNILENDLISLPSNFISLFSTLKIVLELSNNCMKENTDFNIFLSGYMMENDFY